MTEPVRRHAAWRISIPSLHDPVALFVIPGDKYFEAETANFQEIVRSGRLLRGGAAEFEIAATYFPLYQRAQDLPSTEPFSGSRTGLLVSRDEIVECCYVSNRAERRQPAVECDSRQLLLTAVGKVTADQRGLDL